MSGRMSRRVPSAAAAGAVCRRGPVRLLTGPWDAAAGIARRRAGGRPVPRRGPPVARRGRPTRPSSLKGLPALRPFRPRGNEAAAAASFPLRGWSGLENPPNQTELDLGLSQFMYTQIDTPPSRGRSGEDTVTGILRCVSTWPGATLSLYIHRWTLHKGRTTGTLPGDWTVDTLEQSKYLGLLHCGS